MWLQWFPVISTLAAFYVDFICSVAFYRYGDTLVSTLKSGGINSSYFSQLFVNAQLLPILNFYLLALFSSIILAVLILHFLSCRNVRFHRHYLQHIILFRILYLVIIGMHFHKKKIKTNFFTDILCMVTALVNVVLSVVKIINVSTSPIPPSDSTDIYGPSFLGGNQTLVSSGWCLAQVLVSVLSLALCFHALIENYKEGRSSNDEDEEKGYGYYGH